MAPEQNIVHLEIGLPEDIFNFAKSRTDPELSLSDYIECLIRDDRKIRNDNRSLEDALNHGKIEEIVSGEIQESIEMMAPLIARCIVEDVFMSLASDDGRTNVIIEASLPASGWLGESVWNRFDKAFSALPDALKMPLGGGGIALSARLNKKTD